MRGAGHGPAGRGRPDQGPATVGPVREESFGDLLAEQWRRGKLACVGLDPERAAVEASVGWGDPEAAEQGVAPSRERRDGR